MRASKQEWLWIMVLTVCCSHAQMFPGRAPDKDALFGTPQVAAEPRRINPVLNQLDLDGDMVLFLNTEMVEQRVLGEIDQLTGILRSTAGSSAEAHNILAGVTLFKSALQWSGLLSMDAYAVSIKPVDGTLHRVIGVIQHAPEDALKPFWRIFFSEPARLTGIEYVPHDAVYAVNTTASFNELWKVVMEAVSAFLPPGQAREVNQQIESIEQAAEMNLFTLAGSIENEMMMALQLSETRYVNIPAASGRLMIPEPNLLIGLKTKTPQLGSLLLSELAKAQSPIVQSEYRGVTIHTLNLPEQPDIPLQPSMVLADDYLLIGSTKEAVTRAIDSRFDRSGLVTVSLYRKLFNGMPREVSSIAYISPRLMKTCAGAVRHTVSSGSPDDEQLLDLLLSSYENFYMGGYRLKTPTGIYSKSYVDYGGKTPADMLASAYAGMFSALSIPSLINAHSQAQENAKTRTIAEVEKAKGILTLPASVGIPGAMGLSDENVSLEYGEAHQNLLKALRVSDLSELDVGGRSILVGTLGVKARYE